MPLNIDKLFAGHARALGIANQRLQLLAANVANADTPHYKARDIDFKVAMQEAGQHRVQLKGTHPKHLASVGAQNRAEPLYRVPDQPSLDGNTVDTQRESSAIAETAVRYQATLEFLNHRIRGLRLAITGSR
jgi:flagellar basal-body rod protein FlgB